MREINWVEKEGALHFRKLQVDLLPPQSIYTSSLSSTFFSKHFYV